MTSRISLVTLINLPTVGGTLRKSRILHKKDRGSETVVQRDVTAQEGDMGQQMLPSCLPLVNQGPFDDCTHRELLFFFLPASF